MNRHEESKGKERHDDEVDEPDSDGGGRNGGLEGAQIDDSRRDARVDGGGGTGEGVARERRLVRHEAADPALAEDRGEAPRERLELRNNVIRVCGLLARGLDDELHATETSGVPGCVAGARRALQQEGPSPGQTRRRPRPQQGYQGPAQGRQGPL